MARRLARDFDMALCELDGLVYQPCADEPSGNRRRPDSERDALFEAALLGERWVMEDAGRAIFEAAWQAADSIVLLDIPVRVRRRRILLRWIKQRLGIEKCIYTPDMAMLKLMFKWTREYERGADGLALRLRPYQSKVTALRNRRDIERYIANQLL